MTNEIQQVQLKLTTIDQVIDLCYGCLDATLGVASALARAGIVSPAALSSAMQRIQREQQAQSASPVRRLPVEQLRQLFEMIEPSDGAASPGNFQ